VVTASNRDWIRSPPTKSIPWATRVPRYVARSREAFASGIARASQRGVSLVFHERSRAPDDILVLDFWRVRCTVPRERAEGPRDRGRSQKHARASRRNHAESPTLAHGSIKSRRDAMFVSIFFPIKYK